MNRFLRSICIVGLVCLLISCASPTTTSRSVSLPLPQLTPPANLSGTALTAWRVLHATRPTRDLVALMMRLHPELGTISRTVSQPKAPKTVGAEEQFWIQGQDNHYQQITARLNYVTAHVYAYLEDNATITEKDLHTSIDAFENSFRPTDNRYFGQEWSPGIDGDAHITILNATDLGAGENGYFSSADEYPTAVSPFSNQREMIYVHIGDSGVAPGSEAYNEVLAHEYQHLIHWNRHPADPSWVNEGMSVLAQHVNGLDVGGLDMSFMERPDVQLTTWSDGNDVLAHYGAGYLFLDYFAEHYGGYAILHELLDSTAQVPLNFDSVLAAHGYSERFNDVFARWVLTNALNDERQDKNSPYTYKTIAHNHVTPQNTITSLPYTDQQTSAQYATQYYDLQVGTNATSTLQVHFAGQDLTPLTNAPTANQTYWWSNRGDQMDTTLTRSFDLTKVSGGKATLKFSLWYAIESGYDYGYVEISPDGGKTWQTVAIDGASDENPNGTNVGTGFTGISPNADWQPISVDLSPYIGKTIQVRFEATTDDALNLDGIAIANLTIPEIDYIDNPMTPTGWDMQGWLPINSALPQSWIVQAALIKPDGMLDQVKTISVDGNGKGDLTLPDLGKKIARIIFAISPTAPVTTQPATYTLALELK